MVPALTGARFLPRSIRLSGVLICFLNTESGSRKILAVPCQQPSLFEASRPPFGLPPAGLMFLLRARSTDVTMLAVIVAQFIDG